MVGFFQRKNQWLKALVFLAYCCIVTAANPGNTLSVGGLFPQFKVDNNGDYVINPAGVGAMAAAQMAINIVNNKSDGIYDLLLKNTQIQLLAKDSKREEITAISQVYTLAENNCVAYIGPAASTPAKQVSIFASIPLIDSAVIGYAATSTELSEPRFSKFSRTSPADDVTAKIMASMMIDDSFNWKCANVLVGEGDSYSSAGAEAFGKAAKENGINVCTEGTFEPGSGDISDAIGEIMKKRCCSLTVVFASSTDTVDILYEAHKQLYTGEWLMGETIHDSIQYVINELKKKIKGNDAEVYRLLRGIFSLRAKIPSSEEFSNFKRAWFSQTSTATMSTDGTRTACSDAKDATGSYIWRENGLENGRCFGIDFDKVREKHNAEEKCDDDDPICEFTKLSGLIPYAYDAALALAHGLHKLIDDGYDADDMTASRVSEAIRSSSFKGATGQVTFDENGDRRTGDLDFVVYNYQVKGESHRFEEVGHIVNDKFNCSHSDCPPLMFSDGTPKAPNVQRTIFYVGGLFRQFRKGKISDTGVRRMAAVQLAFDRLNNKNDGFHDELLKHTELRLLVRDSKGDASTALARVYDLTVIKCVAIIGPASSTPSKEVSSWLSKLSHANRAVIGYSATSEELNTFTNFVRTPPADDAEAKMMLRFMKDKLKWTCANVISVVGDSFSTFGARAFVEEAEKHEKFDVCQVNYNPDSGDMGDTIELMQNQECCKATVIFAQIGGYSSLLRAAYDKKWEGEWILGSNIGNGIDSVVNTLKQDDKIGNDDEKLYSILNGLFYLVVESRGDEYDDFVQVWNSQNSTAKMSKDGTRIEDTCSDAKDATGSYIWRENGLENGRCFGIDFEQAARKHKEDKCGDDDPVCASNRISNYVPYAYDAALALAHGLHKLVNKGYDADDMTASRVSKAIRSSSFKGATGQVMFDDNGDRRTGDLDFVVYNYQVKGESHRFEEVGHLADGGFVQCKDDTCSDVMIFSDGTTNIPDVKFPKEEEEEGKLLIFIAVAISSFVFCFILVVVIFCLCNWCKKRRARERKRKAKELLHSRLLKNWSALLSSASVDDLSQMPEEWKSAIVPCRGKIGRGLKRDMQEIGKEVENISNRCWYCGNKMEEKKLLEVKKSIEDFMQKSVAVFFEERHKMYKLYLLENPEMTGEPTATTKTNDKEQEASEKSKSKVEGPISNVVYPEQKSEADIDSWPKNTTPLFKQIMFLLRDLDDMFKASYNQRFNLRILDSEMEQWTEWTHNEFPKFMPENVVLRQSTPEVYDLYRQAAEVHAYYNSVFASIAKATKAEWIPSSLKKLFRILEKAKHSRKGDHVDFNCSKIFDIVRGTLVYDTLGDNEGGLLRGVHAAVSSEKFQVVRLKDRFSNPTSACWRDVLLNGRMVTSDGKVLPHLVEVQFHQRDLREERMNVGGHFIYERHRALFEACEMACGSEAGEKLKQLHNDSSEDDRQQRLSQLGQRRNAIRNFATVIMKAHRLSMVVPTPIHYLHSSQSKIAPSPISQ